MKLHNIILFILILLTSQACTRESKPNGKVEIVINNTSLHSINRTDLDSRIGYNNHEEKNRALNILSCKISNNSSDKLIFVFDPIQFPAGYLQLIVKDKNGVEKKLRVISDIYGGEDESFIDFLKCKKNIRDYENEKYEDLDIPDIYTYKEYHEKSFILSPGEEKKFSIKVYLPLIVYDAASFDDLVLSYFKDLAVGDSLSLQYKIDSKQFEKALPEWELQELKSKGIKFYSNTIKSNAVPITIIE